MKYDAFISYSHAADGALAPALQRGLHHLAKRWYALRALRIFRDETNLAAEPGLWPTIQAALAQSRFLILMASPEAARSKWVAKELDWWLMNRRVSHLLVVLSSGELQWNDDGHDFDWATTDALPQAMIGRFADEPKYVDLRWAHTDARLTLDHLAFRSAVLDLAAPIHGMDKDLLDGEDVRQLQRTRMLARSAVAGLATLAIVSTISAFVAVQQRRVAQSERAVAVEQSRIALARQLAAQSSLILRQNPDRLPLAVLLALESLERHPSFDGNQALRASMSLLPQLEWSSGHVSAPQRGRVRALGFSADGALLAAAREDGTAELFNLRSRQTVATLAHDQHPGVVTETPGGGIRWKAPGADAEVVALAFSPDGRLLATGSNDGGTRLWKLSDASLIRHLEGHEEVRAVLFSPNGRYLAAIDVGACVRLLDLDAPDASARRWCQGDAGLGLAFSADSSRLATASGDRAGVFDVQTGRRLFEATHHLRRPDGYPEHFKWIDQVAFSPDGEWLATAGRDGTARVWDLASGQETVRLSHQAPVQALAFSADGAQLLTASADGTARLWDVPSGRERLRAVHPGGSEGVAFSPQGRLVASGGSDGSIGLWRLTPGDQPVVIRQGGGGATVAVSPVETVGMGSDGRMASVDRKGELRLWSATGELLGRRGGLYGANRLMFSEDGRHLIVRARQPAASVLDLQKELAPVALRSVRDADHVVLSSRYIAARDRRQRRLLVWTTGGEPLTVTDEDDPWELRFDARAQHLATLHQDQKGVGSIRLRSLPDLKETGRIPIDHRPEFALSPDGASLAMTGRERDKESSPWRKHVDVFDAVSARRTLRLAEDRTLTWLQFSPDGRHLFSVGESFGDQARELRVWSLADGRLEASLRHENDIQGVRISPKGDMLATRAGRQIYVWRVPDGRLQSQIASEAGFRDYDFSPDGRVLLTGADDGRMVTWLWRSEDLRDEACRRLTRNLAADEWVRYLGERPYRATCQGVPTDPKAIRERPQAALPPPPEGVEKLGSGPSFSQETASSAGSTPQR